MCVPFLAEGVHESEADYAKVVSLAPAEVVVGSGDIAVTQIACGVHHTVVLLQNGDVYTFGNNSYGQLGLGDTSPRCVCLWCVCVCVLCVCACITGVCVCGGGGCRLVDVQMLACICVCVCLCVCMCVCVCFCV